MTSSETWYYHMIIKDYALVYIMNAVPSFEEHGGHMWISQLPSMVAVCIARRKPSRDHASDGSGLSRRQLGDMVSRVSVRLQWLNHHHYDELRRQ